MKEEDVSICDELQVIRMAEHETLLSFNTDDQSAEFQDWWNIVGKKLFVKHYNKRKKSI